MKLFKEIVRLENDQHSSLGSTARSPLRLVAAATAAAAAAAAGISDYLDPNTEISTETMPRNSSKESLGSHGSQGSLDNMSPPIDEDDGSGIQNSPSTKTRGGAASISEDSVFAAYSDFSGRSLLDPSRRRNILFLLTIAIGSLCMFVDTGDEVSDVSGGAGAAAPVPSLRASGKGNSDQASPSKKITVYSRNTMPWVNQEALGTASVCDILIRSLENCHVNDLRLVETILRAIYYVVHEHSTNQKKMFQLKAAELLVKILRMNVHKPRVVYYSLLCIGALADNHRENSVALGTLLCGFLNFLTVSFVVQ
jgi:hypothetical protein